MLSRPFLLLLQKLHPALGFSLFKVVFVAAVLTWGFQLWVSASVRHLETILIGKGSRDIN